VPRALLGRGPRDAKTLPIFYFYFLFYFSYILGAKNSVREQLGPPFKGREDFAPLDVLLHTAGLQPPALNLFEKGGGKELISPADVYI